MKPYRITLHCSDSENGKLASVDEIRRWHVVRGFKDIGYHFVIYPDGGIHAGRPLDQTGAHVKGENTGNVGICLNGRDKFTPAQFDGLRLLLNQLFNRFIIVPADLYCHYEFPSAQQQGKSCPNIRIEDLVYWFFDSEHEAIKPYLLEDK